MTKKTTHKGTKKKGTDKRAHQDEVLGGEMRLFSLGIEQCPEGMVFMDLDGNVEYANRAFGEMHGYPPGQMKGKAVSECLVPDEASFVENFIENVIEQGEGQGKFHHQRQDKTVFLAFMHFSLIRDEAGNPMGMMGTLRDTGGGVGPEREEGGPHEKHESMAQSVVDAIIILEGNDIRVANESTLKMFGYQKEEEVIGSPITMFLSPEQGDLMAATGKDGECRLDMPGQYECEAIRKDGKEFLTEVSVSAIKYHGKDARIVSIRDITEQKEIQKALRESHENLNALLENTEDSIFITDKDLRLVVYNSTYAQRVKDNMGIELKPGMELPIMTIPEVDEDGSLMEAYGRVLKGEKVKMVVPLATPKGGVGYIEPFISPIRGDDAQVKGVSVVLRDVTDQVHMEEALRRVNDELETKVKERTAQLRETNKDLQAQTYKLEELNTALRVLLKAREEDKTKIEQNVLSNVKELVEPYLEAVNQTNLDETQRSYLEIVDANLKEIISPFLANVSSKYLKLTPSEIQVAHLIRHGKTTKEIAELLKLSRYTINFHRDNIRKKIGIKNKKEHLRSHLLTLMD